MLNRCARYFDACDFKLVIRCFHTGAHRQKKGENGHQLGKKLEVLVLIEAFAAKTVPSLNLYASTARQLADEATVFLSWHAIHSLLSKETVIRMSTGST